MPCIPHVGNMPIVFSLQYKCSNQLQVPWERESIETCTVMNSLGYGSYIRQARGDAYREHDRIRSANDSLTQITTGSKAEGVTSGYESDRDIMLVPQYVMCLERI
ncbi:hypothetical protein DPMN_037755 [Dreissena polymorpha]|uniref:Uncharacterized protein n=1 Tax=Dreissena polymorpha TaxID=45954 RepID=A0A9D4ME58_DREPO|nr:hypothetical protein DPMN_037755 [Dreissena polymorpha]